MIPETRTATAGVSSNGDALKIFTYPTTDRQNLEANTENILTASANEPIFGTRTVTDTSLLHRNTEGDAICDDCAMHPQSSGAADPASHTVGPIEESERSRNIQRATTPITSVSEDLKCPHCSHQFARHHNLKTHLLTHSDSERTVHRCSDCTYRFRRLQDLKRHSKFHTGSTRTGSWLSDGED